MRIYAIAPYIVIYEGSQDSDTVIIHRIVHGCGDRASAQYGFAYCALHGGAVRHRGSPFAKGARSGLTAAHDAGGFHRQVE